MSQNFGDMATLACKRGWESINTWEKGFGPIVIHLLGLHTLSLCRPGPKEQGRRCCLLGKQLTVPPQSYNKSMYKGPWLPLFTEINQFQAVCQALKY